MLNMPALDPALIYDMRGQGLRVAGAFDRHAQATAPLTGGELDAIADVSE
jgi:hypothetical protein